MTTYLKKKLPVIATALVLWAVLAFTQKAFLLKTCDLSLFLFDGTFFKESFMIPGGFLGWAGSFFTQFMYIPWLGSLIWVALLTLAGMLTVRVFSIPSRLVTLATLPIALLVIANMSLGYGIYLMRIQEYFFAPTLGYLLMLAIAAATWNSQKTWQRIAILTVSAFAGYILAGVFALAGVAVAGLGLAFGPGEDKMWKKVSAPFFSAILCIVVPLILFPLFTRYRLVDSWHMGLPSVSNHEWTAPVRLPFWILFGLSALFALTRNLLAKSGENGKKTTAFHIASAAIAIGSVLIFWYRDENFKTELEMTLAADRFDWKEVTDIYHEASVKHISREKKTFEKRQDALSGIQDKPTYDVIISDYEDKFFKPTRLMVILRDLALLKQDKALEQAFTMRDGGRPQKSRTQVAMVLQGGRQIYFNYGLVNQEYRWCLEDQVEHGWCYGTLKYMAMHAILMNETEFASKYLDKLDKTLFYRKWSRGQRPLASDAKAMAQSLPYREILPYMSFNDRMSNDRVKIETYLMQHFSEDRDPQSTFQFDCAALLWAMRSQDIPMFWKALAQYIETAPEFKLPRSVQEAVVLYSSLEKEDMGIPVDKAVADSYSAFQKMVKQSGFRSEKEAEFPIWQKFGNTFYFYYYFIRGLQTF